MPVYDISGVKSTGPRVARQSAPGADAFGAGLAQGINQAADVATRRALEMKAEEDEARARELDTQFSQALIKVLHDPEDGYFSKKGRNAMDGFKPTQEQVEKIRRDIEAQATNDTQRQLFSRAAQARQTSNLEAMSRHSARETTAWKNQVDEAASIQAVDTAVANRTDPKIIAQNLQAGRFSQARMLDRAGVTGEAKQVAMEAWETKAHLAVIDGLTQDEDYGAAEKYYEANKERIDGTARPKVEAAIANGRREAVGQRAADFYAGSGMTEAEALADARKRFSGKQEDEAVRRIKIRFAEREQEKKKAELDSFDEVQKLFAQGGKKDDIPKATWEALDGASRLAVNKMEADRLAPDKARTDPRAHIELYDKLDKGEIRTQQELDKYRPFLSSSDYEAASKELRQRGSAKETELKSAYLKFSGKKSLKDEDDFADYVAFTEYARARIAETKQNDYDDIETLAARWKMEGSDGTTFGPGTFGEAYQEGRLGSFTFETPEDVLDEVKAVMGFVQKWETPSKEDVSTREFLGLSPAKPKLVKAPWDGDVDAFYTSRYQPAVEELKRRGRLVTPETIAAAIQIMFED